MAVSKRIQVLLKPYLTEAVEQLAEQQGETLSRMTALLVQEALTARGVHPSLRPTVEDSINRLEAAEAEVERVSVNTAPSEGLSFTQRQHQRIAEANLKEAATAADEAIDDRQDELDARVAVQRQKLQLMQDLMEQLKSM